MQNNSQSDPIVTSIRQIERSWKPILLITLAWAASALFACLVVQFSAYSILKITDALHLFQQSFVLFAFLAAALTALILRLTLAGFRWKSILTLIAIPVAAAAYPYWMDRSLNFAPGLLSLAIAIPLALQLAGIPLNRRAVLLTSAVFPVIYLAGAPLNLDHHLTRFVHQTAFDLQNLSWSQNYELASPWILQSFVIYPLFCAGLLGLVASLVIFLQIHLRNGAADAAVFQVQPGLVVKATWAAAGLVALILALAYGSTTNVVVNLSCQALENLNVYQSADDKALIDWIPSGSLVKVIGRTSYTRPSFMVVASYVEPEKTVSVSRVLTGAPAEQAGFREGDELVAFGGRSIVSWDQLPVYVGAHKDQQIRLFIRRGKQHIPLLVTPRIIDETQKGRIGIEYQDPTRIINGYVNSHLLYCPP